MAKSKVFIMAASKRTGEVFEIEIPSLLDAEAVMTDLSAKYGEMVWGIYAVGGGAPISGARKDFAKQSKVEIQEVMVVAMSYETGEVIDKRFMMAVGFGNNEAAIDRVIESITKEYGKVLFATYIIDSEFGVDDAYADFSAYVNRAFK